MLYNNSDMSANNKFYSPKFKNENFTRTCKKEPVASFGLIIFFVDKDETVYFLIQQRRDTFEYSDFLQGKWMQPNQISSFFVLMSTEERNRIRNYMFDELWDDMWIDKKTKIYRDTYERAKRKYDSVRHLIPNIIDTTQTHVGGAPWGFPKGKKNSFKEEDYECAIRETTEETKIPQSEYEVIRSYKYYEQFQGTDGINYSTCYFLGKAKRKFLPEIMNLEDGIRKMSLSEEANAIKWVTYEEAAEYLNPKRLLILQNILQICTKNFGK